MQGGFSFCGVDISELGLEYAPDLTRTYVYSGSSYKVHEQSFDGHDGGYYYGSTVAPKTFELRCIFQDRHVNDGVLTHIERFFRRGRTGPLVFSKRPWVSYTATVVKLDASQLTNYKNGVVTISLTAYYPYAVHPQNWLDLTSSHLTNMMNNSGLLFEAMTPSTSIIASGGTMTEQTSFLLYNGGTEPSPLAIHIAGDATEGVVIANAATRQKCAFIALSSAITSDAGKYLRCDPISGLTVLTDGISEELAYLYHDYGFQDLVPGDPVRNISFTSVAGSTSVTLSAVPAWLEDPVGRYIYLGGNWVEIVAHPSSDTLTVRTALAASESGSTIIATMNKITVTPVGEMSLTQLDFDYKPTFA